MLKDKFVKVDAKCIQFKRKMHHSLVSFEVIKAFEARYPFAKDAFFYSAGKICEVKFYFCFHSNIMAN